MIKTITFLSLSSIIFGFICKPTIVSYAVFGVSVNAILNALVVFANISIIIMICGTIFFTQVNTWKKNCIKVVGCVLYLILLNTNIQSCLNIGIILSAIGSIAIITSYELIQKKVDTDILSKYLFAIFVFELYYTGGLINLINHLPVFPSTTGLLALSLVYFLCYFFLLLYIIKKIRSKIKSKGIKRSLLGLKFTKILAFVRLVQNKQKDSKPLVYVENTMFAVMLLVSSCFYFGLPFFSIFIAYSSYYYGTVGFWLLFLYLFIVTICVQNKTFQQHCKNRYSRVFFKLCLWNTVAKVCQHCAMLVTSVGFVGIAGDASSTAYNNSKYQNHLDSTAGYHALWKKNVLIIGKKAAGPEPTILSRSHPSFNTHLVTHGVNAVKEAAKAVPFPWEKPGPGGQISLVKIVGFL